MIELKHLEAMNEQALYEKFRSACSIDTDLSIAQLICTTTYLNGDLFSFAGYEYLIDAVEDTHPWQVIIKPAQKGASEIFARKLFALLYRYGQTPHYYEENGAESCIWGISAIYSFPDDNSLQKFSKDRILANIIKVSPAYYAAMKESESEAASQIGIFNSFAYLIGRKSDTSNQSIPAEIIMIDESDRPLAGDRKIRSQLYGRTRNARIFGNSFYKGMTINYGTPTLPDEDGATDLLDGMYAGSDQLEYVVKCPKCNHWQVITFPDSIAHFYEPGQKPGPKDPYWMCLKCKRPIDWTRIGMWNRSEPNKNHNAQWVAKYPERTKDGNGTRGRRIPFATARDTAKVLLIERDTKWKNSKADFYNLGLGIAYRDNSIGLGEEDFVRAATDQVQWGFCDPSAPHIMGVDQGMYVVIARLKEGSQTDINPQGIWQIVWCQHVRDSDAFSKIIKVQDQLQIYEGEFAKLVKKWSPEVIVMDHLPNTASAEAEANIFRETMWLCDSKGNAGMARLRIDEEDAEGNIVHKLLEHKHLAIDEFFEQVRGQKWEFPLHPDGDTFRTFKTHLKNIKKIVDTEKHTFTYESFGEDHYGQAAKLCCEASEVYHVIKPRSKRAGILLISGFRSRQG